MSIFGSLCVLRDRLITLFPKFFIILGDDGQDRSWIHPEHRLKLVERRDPFYCMACKEIGFGCSYACGPCAVLLHRECMSPPVATSHPLPEYPDDLSFVRSLKTYDPKTDTDTDVDKDDHGGSKFCGACSKPLRGCGYMSAGGESCFHPCCLHLERFIKVNGEKLKLKMKNISSKCNWCKELIRDQGTVIPSWSYVSVRKDRRFHVGCVQDMMLESWRDNGIDQFVRGKEEDSTANFTTCLSLNIKLPINEKEEREADPSDSAMQTASNLIMKDILGGSGPLATAVGDQLNSIIAALGDGLGALTKGVESGSSQVWELTKILWRVLLLKIRQGMAQLADTPVGRAGCEVWTTITQPSKLWERIRPLLQWVSSKLCELASRMLIGKSSPLGQLPNHAQACLMDSI